MTPALQVLVALAVVAQGDDGTLAETLTDARIDWSQRTLSVTGRGAPPAAAAGVVPWRVAEATARRDARDRALLVLRGVRAQGTSTVATLLDQAPERGPTVAAAVEAFTPADTRYYSDGGIDVVLRGALGGPLLAALFPEAGKAVPPPLDPAEETTTGVIVNARGTGASAALMLRLVDETGASLFEAASLSAEGLDRHGSAAYFRSLERAMQDARAGGKPLVLKALRTVQPQSADLVLGTADASRLRRLAAVLAAGRVAVVLD